MENKKRWTMYWECQFTACGAANMQELIREYIDEVAILACFQKEGVEVDLDYSEPEEGMFYLYTENEEVATDLGFDLEDEIDLEGENCECEQVCNECKCKEQKGNMN